MNDKAEGNGHRTETPDVSHIRNVEVAHEMSDINVTGVLTFVLALIVASVVIHVGMFFLFNFFNQQEKEPDPGPMALTRQERLPPEPRLQGAPGFALTLQNGQTVRLNLREPQAEYRVLRQEWERQLQQAPIPIDQAMQKVLDTLPVRAKDAPAKLDDYAIKTPTAASSGRETEKRVQ